MILLRSTLASAICVFVLAGCSGRDDAAGTSARVERETIGDTTVVRTVTGSAWGDTARLVEELRIGTLEGREELTFGRIGDIAVAPNGAIFVYDGQAVTIRQFDSTGAFVRRVGGKGQGPGEHQTILGMTVLRDGRLVAYDVQNSRINLYAADDSAGSWPLRTTSSPLYSDNSFAADSADGLYLQMMVREEAGSAGARSRRAFFRVTPGDSTVDTLFVPTFPPAPPSVRLHPRGQWAVHPHGYFVAGMNDRYSFDLARPEGVLRIQRTASAPEFDPDERTEWETELANADPDILSMEVTRGKAPVVTYGDKPTLAKVKPVYKSLAAAADGRIWVHLHTRARKTDAPAAGGERASPMPSGLPTLPGSKPVPPRRWLEPAIYDVFEPDGRYLGPVAVPDGVTLHIMRGDRVWGVAKGESDEEYVVRYRLTTSPRS